MFASFIRAEAQDRSPWGDFWFEPAGIRSLSGARVDAASAMRLSAVHACVSLLSRSFAVLPFVLYRPKKGGGREKVVDHWVYQLFAKRPNRFQNAFEWRETLQGHLELRGNAYNRILANSRGEVTDLVPIHPDRIKPEVFDDGSYRWRVTERSGTETVLVPGEVWHLRGFSGDGLLGLSRIDVAREVIGLGLAAQYYATRFFANDARPTAGWIKYAGRFKDDAAKRTFKESWQRSQTGENRGGVAVLEDGMEYKDPPAVSLKDLQFLELRAQSLADVCRMFGGVPPHLVGDLSRSTNNNIEQQALEFVTYCMQPIAERWEAAIEAEFIADDEMLEVEFDFKNLLRADSAARSTYYKNGIFAGYLTRNEVREDEGRDPIDGLDEPLQPTNMMISGDDPPSSQPAKQPAPDGETGTSPDARLAALAESAAERIARKELLMIEQAGRGAPGALAEAYAKHADFVQRALRVDASEARAHCDAQIAWIQAAGADLESDVFVAATQLKLLKLALKGNA